jgi:hypothetical protein
MATIRRRYIKPKLAIPAQPSNLQEDYLFNAAGYIKAFDGMNHLLSCNYIIRGKRVSI